MTVKRGLCQGGIRKVGQTFRVGETAPKGLCVGALDAIYPYLMTLQHGADLPWERKKGVATIHCPDPEGVVLELRRVAE